MDLADVSDHDSFLLTPLSTSSFFPNHSRCTVLGRISHRRCAALRYPGLGKLRRQLIVFQQGLCEDRSLQLSSCLVLAFGACRLLGVTWRYPDPETGPYLFPTTGFRNYRVATLVRRCSPLKSRSRSTSALLCGNLLYRACTRLYSVPRFQLLRQSAL